MRNRSKNQRIIATPAILLNVERSEAKDGTRGVLLWLEVGGATTRLTLTSADGLRLHDGLLALKSAG